MTGQRSVIEPTRWLDDEVVDAMVDWVAVVGNNDTTTNARSNIPRVVALHSQFYHNIESKGPRSVENWMRRTGAMGKSLLNVETLLNGNRC